jgi:hypothetical protein
MILDINFSRVINKYFKSLKIELCLVNISTYYESKFAKNPIELIKKGLREIDILISLPAGINDEGIINILEPAFICFNEEVRNNLLNECTDINPANCYLIPKSSIWAVMRLWKITTPDGEKYYTYKSVHEVNSNIVLKINALKDEVKNPGGVLSLV